MFYFLFFFTLPLLLSLILLFLANWDQDPMQRQLLKQGFYYDDINDCIHTVKTRLFSPKTVYEEEIIEFEHKQNQWILQLRKGQYGIATGCEIRLSQDGIPQAKLSISYTLKHGKQELFTYEKKHFHFGSYKLGCFFPPGTLAMDVKIKFSDPDLCDALTNALHSTGYTSCEFLKNRQTVWIHFTKAHSSIKVKRDPKRLYKTMASNERFCQIYQKLNHEYANTLDKLTYLKSYHPHLFQQIFS